MRFTFVSLIFFFFINVLATPISHSRGDAMALRTISDLRTNVVHKEEQVAAECKHATPNELIAALNGDRRTIVGDQDCSVFNLTTKVDNENVIVKVIQNGLRDEGVIIDEAWALENVNQLRGWAHTPDKKLYYLFMRDMGVSLRWTGFEKDVQRVQELEKKAEEFYTSHYHLTHNDYTFESPQNWAFRQVHGKWQAELIDWEHSTKESGYKHYKDAPKPFEIDPNRDFVPRMMRKYLVTATK